jgi:hypothetical protein
MSILNSSLLLAESFVYTNLWTPANASPGTRVWYDPSNISSLSLSGSSVIQMNDLSGNNFHASQSNSALRPTSGFRINGKNVLNYSSDTLNLPSHPFTAASGAASCVYVCRYGFDPTSTSVQFGGIMSGWGPTSGNGEYSLHPNGTIYAGWCRSGGPQGVGGVGGGNLAAANSLFTFGASSSRWLIRRNGGTFPISCGGTFGVLTTAPVIGSSGVGYYAGLLGEMVMYNYDDETTLQKTEGYMAYKYGTQGLLPSNHPYRYIPPLL